MGWKFSLVGIPVESAPDADGLAMDLGFPEFIRESTLERCLYPAPKLSIGCWKQALLLSSEPLVEQLLLDDKGEKRRQLLTRLPKREVYAAQVHSVSDFYAFALFREGETVRLRVGCADEGDMVSVGEPFSWEASHVEEGWFDGEGAVFSFLAPLLGASFDQTPDEFFETPFREYSKPKAKRFFSRLFRR